MDLLSVKSGLVQSFSRSDTLEIINHKPSSTFGWVGVYAVIFRLEETKVRVIIQALGRGGVSDGTLELSTSMFKIQIPYPSSTVDNTLIHLAIAQFLVKLKFNHLQWYSHITHLSNQPNQFWIELQSQEGCIGLYVSDINYDPMFLVKYLKEPIIGVVTELLEEMI